ncbi:hypothetical protein R0G64_29860, partial [Pseudomonas otitidis]
DIAESILYMLADSLLSATLSPAHIEDGEEVEVVGHLALDEPFNGADGLEIGEWEFVPERSAVESMLAVSTGEMVPLMTVAQHQRIVAARASKTAARVEDAQSALTSIMEWTAAATVPDERKLCLIRNAARAALSAPPAAGVPIGMACKINGYWEAQLFAGHGCIDRQSLYAQPLPPADVPTGLAHRLLKAYDHGDTGAIEAAIEDIRTMLAAAPTPPASEQQRAVVMPEGKLLVSAEPLRKVLFALLGAPHHIRELQATRTPTDLFADNPINVLIAELNAAQGGDA